MAWTHLWSGTSYRGGADVTVPAPIGAPPVFFREGSVWEGLFRQVTDIA
jgi:alpha-glucosidase